VLDFLLIVFLAGALKRWQLPLIVVLAKLATVLVWRLFEAQVYGCVVCTADVDNVGLFVVVA
jgi:hypothetical protein